MKHNVNFGLLGLLLMVIVAMIALVLYYYTTYEGLSKRYDDALANLQNVSEGMNRTQMDLAAKEQQLSEKERRLLEMTTDTNVSKEQVQFISGQYTHLKDKADDLSTDLNATRDERNKYAAQADKYYKDSVQWQGKYTDTNNALTSANNRITRIRGSLVELDTAFSPMGDEMASMKDSLTEVDSLADAIKAGRSNQTIVNSKATELKDTVDSMGSTVTAKSSSSVESMC